MVKRKYLGVRYYDKGGIDKMYNVEEECKAMAATLKKLCEKEGMSPHAVAKKAGISTSTISYIMKGETNPQVYTLMQLCNALGVQIGDLFDGKDDDVFETVGYITREEKELVDSYRCLSDKKKELLRIYADMLRRYDEELLTNG